MSLSFQCSNCQSEVAVRFLKPGEKALCRECGERVTIPNDAAQIDVMPRLSAEMPVVDGVSEPYVFRKPSLSVGSVLGRSFTIFFQNLLPFTLLTTLALSPMVVYVIIFIQGRITQSGLETYAMVTLVGTTLLSLIATGAIAYGVFEQLRGRHAPIGRCISVGLSRMFPILGVGILVSLSVLAGMLALIIPGLILICMLWLAVPVTVVERVGPVEAMKRSALLTKGVKWPIFWILFLLGVLSSVADLILQEAVLGNNPSIPEAKTYLVLAVVLGIIFATINAVANAVTYHDIVTEREGVDLDELVAIFD